MHLMKPGLQQSVSANAEGETMQVRPVEKLNLARLLVQHSSKTLGWTISHMQMHIPAGMLYDAKTVSCSFFAVISKNVNQLFQLDFLNVA